MIYTVESHTGDRTHVVTLKFEGDKKKYHTVTYINVCRESRCRIFQNAFSSHCKLCRCVCVVYGHCLWLGSPIVYFAFSEGARCRLIPKTSPRLENHEIFFFLSSTQRRHSSVLAVCCLLSNCCEEPYNLTVLLFLSLFVYLSYIWHLRHFRRWPYPELLTGAIEVKCLVQGHIDWFFS